MVKVRKSHTESRELTEVGHGGIKTNLSTDKTTTIINTSEN